MSKESQVKEIHPALKSQKCTVCDIKVGSIQLMSLHMQNAHSETCNNKLERMEELLISVSKESPTTIIKEATKSLDCSECGLVFPTVEVQVQHMNEKHVRKSPKMGDFQCEECNKFFDTRKHMTEHIQHLHESKITSKCEVSLSGSEDESEDYDDLAHYDIEYTPKSGPPE